MENTNQFLGTERVGKLMRRYAVPCIISLLVGALYNIVDQIFIANASYLGSYGNAANTVVFPLTVVALGHRRDDRRRLLRVRQYLARQGRGGRGEKERRQRGRAVDCEQPSPDGAVPCFCRRHYLDVRRHGERGDLSLRAGVFLLYLARHPILYVRAGDEPRHPRRWRPAVCHALHARGRGAHTF